jgi:CheY-like chemotaxis protein
MGSAYPLTGRSILVVEDEPLISLEMTALFQSAGARVLSAMNLPAAIALTAAPGLSAAILDYGLGIEKVQTLCAHLAERGIPFMFYTGYADLQQSYPTTLVVQKPASGDTLLAAMSALVDDKRIGAGLMRHIERV